MRTPFTATRRTAALHPTPLLASFLVLATIVALAACVPLPASPATGQIVSATATPHPLVGSTWVLTAMNGWSPIAGSHLTLIFAPDELSGSSGCNNFFGEYSIEGDRLITGVIGNTVMACKPSSIMEQEEDYLAVVREGGQFRWDGDRLEILNPSGKVVLAFVRRSEIRPTPGPEPTLPAFTPDPPRAPGVADLFAQRPADGQTVEVDAYFSAAGAPSWPGGGPPPPQDDQVWCPPAWPYTLTDRPYPVALSYLNATTSNLPPDDAPWLIAALPEQTQPNASARPALPYHARLAGHLGDPAFAGLDCQHGERIFVVERVVQVYQQAVPQAVQPGSAALLDYAAWPRYADPAQGYSVPYPPDWSAHLLDDGALALIGPQWPGHPVLVRVHEGGLNYDQYDPANAPALLRDVAGWGQFQQGGWPYDQVTPPTQGLTGFLVDRTSSGSDSARPIAVLLGGQARTYEIGLAYPTGFAASPALLNDFTAIVEGFRLDELPGPTATPPIRQTLGPGPFLTEEEAFARARERSESPLENLGGELLSEAAARQIVANSPCNTFTGHPEGVWLLRVSGEFEGRQMELRLLIDAVTGEQLCGEEIAGVQ